MRRLPIIFILLVPLFLLFENCGPEEEEVPNKPPTCSFTSPSNNAVIELGTIASVSLSAKDADGKIVSIKISIDDVSATTLQVSPYKYDWNTAGLTPGAHAIKAVAMDDGGLTAMAQVTVELAADAPAVTTDDISGITGSTATSGGNVTDDGGAAITARGIVWGETGGPTLESKVGFTEDGSGTGAFVSNLASLTPETTYYVKAYATNSAGTAYGEEKSFTTAGLPTVVTGEVIGIYYDSAACSGEVTSSGGTEITARGFVWRETGVGHPTLEENDGFTIEGNGLGAYSGSITPLDYVTSYYVRAYATNNAGTSYGDLKVFTTIPGPPSVTIVSVTNIDAHVATATAEVIDLAGASTCWIGIYWDIFENPDSDNHQGYIGQTVYAEGKVEVLLTGLSPEAIYYIRAIVGSNADIVVNGEENSFTTSPFTYQADSFTDARDNISYNTVTISGQTWMAENLAYLPEVCDVDTECGYWVYDYIGTDIAAAKATSNYSDYGVLYSQVTAKEVCPAGWHLPSSEEWSLLEINIGMEYNFAYGGLTRINTTEGDKLKEVGEAHWKDTYLGPNSGTNITGFTALPGGYRDIITNNKFQWMATHAYFWTSTVDGNTELHSHFRSIQDAGIYKTRWSKDPYENQGMSVRCVKD